jgi:ribonuclease D
MRRGKTTIEFITTRQELVKICSHFSKLTYKEPNNFVTVDTEFVRRTTYFPELSLIQIGIPGIAAVIDYTKFSKKELEPFLEIMCSPYIVKVIHSARQDCEALYHALRILPSPLFDTQIAAAMVGLGGTAGYELLAESLLSISLDKTYQTSDWLCRPLSDDQIMYAANDVIYLIDIYRMLLVKTSTLGRDKWAFDESATLLDRNLYDVDSSTMWKKFLFAQHQWKAAVTMKYLMAWREEKAIEFNVPRGHVISDQMLLQFCVQRSVSKVYRSTIVGIYHHFRGSEKSFSVSFWQQNDLFGSFDRLMLQIDNVISGYSKERISSFKAELEQISESRNNRSDGYNVKNKLRKFCNECAKKNLIAEHLFASKNDISMLIDGVRKTGSLWKTKSRLSRGWRKILLKEYVSNTCNEIADFLAAIHQ